jgi:hypothetical protein
MPPLGELLLDLDQVAGNPVPGVPLSLDIANVLAGCSFFSQVDSASRKRLIRMAVPREFRKGEVIFREGDSAPGIFIVTKGLVRIYKLAATGKEHVLHLAGPGMNSHNHIMLGSVDAWFYKTIGGIALMEPGWKKVRIAPRPFEGLTSAETSVMTVRGEVRVRWSRETKRFIENGEFGSADIDENIWLNAELMKISAVANQSFLGRFLLQKTWGITGLSEPHGCLGVTGKILSIRF